MLMTLVLPGSAQLVAGNRRVGVMAMRIWFALVLTTVTVGVAALVHHEFAFWLVSSTRTLFLLRWGLTVLAVAWAVLFMDAWRIGQPLTLHHQHRRAVVGVNGVLCLSVAGSLLFGAHLVGVQRGFMLSMFGDSAVTGAHDGRFNVLLVGGDSGAGRWGLRTDSMTVASIDARTGKTVLISLPRNMTNFPFAKGSVMAKAWPHGFNCGYPDCELNGVNTWVGDHTSLFKHDKNPGMTATISAIEGITQLKINYWAMVNLEGFKSLVDAVGGVKLNVRQPIPVGLPTDPFFHYVKAGNRVLNGVDTLWYARARYDSDDYSRMARQKCVMSAMLHQISPQVALRNFEKIARASSEMISTNIPASEVDRFLDLALKAKSQKIATVSLVPPAINTADPDMDKVHQMIAEAIDRSEGTAAPAARKKHHPASQGTTGGSIGSLSGGYAANQSQDLSNAC